MRKIIKQIGFEGRTTIPQVLRDYMGIEDKDFISFELAPDGRSIVIRKEEFCDCDLEVVPDEMKGKKEVILKGFSKEEAEKVLFIMNYVLEKEGVSV